jgi:SAM-dependent methyltransferase
MDNDRPTSLKEFTPQVAPVPCDCCGSTDFLEFCSRMRHGLDLKTVLCARCGLAQTNPQPTAQCLDVFYDKFYHLFHGRAGVDAGYVEKSKRLAERRFQRAKSHLDPAQEISVLEIGPGAGQFLAAIKANTAWDAEGIEPGSESWQWCQSLGLNVAHIRFEDFQPQGQYDLVASFHVLEHVVSPKAFLKKCRSMLTEKGLLYLEVPNLNCPRSPYRQFLQFPHLYSFTLTSLWGYLAAAGLAPVFVDDTSVLTIISVAGAAGRSPFVATDPERQRQLLRRKDHIRNAARWLPNVPGLRRVRALVESI